MTEIDEKTAETFYVKETIIETVADADIKYDDDKGDSISYGEEKHKRERMFGPFSKDDADTEITRLRDRHKALDMDGTQRIEKISSRRIESAEERNRKVAKPEALKDIVTDVLAGKDERTGNHPDAAAQKDVTTDVEK